MLFAAAAASVLLVHGAAAQTSPDAGTTAAPGQKPAKKKKAPAPADKTTTSEKSKTSKKGKKGAPPPAAAPAPTPAAPAQPEIDEETRKALEGISPTPKPTAPAPTPAPETYAGPEDNEPPVITHTPITKATKGKPITATATVNDPSGVFGVVLYMRKKGMGVTEYIPIKMNPSKTSPRDYSAEIAAPLLSVDALEYYIEAWDNAGNGPSRAGSPEKPLPIAVEEEKKIIVAPTVPVAPPTVTIKPKGAPPAISHTAVTTATKGAPIEINARLIGDTGVQDAKVFFRHAGETEYKALPMGAMGGDDYTSTVPASQATSDIEYYLEAYDKYGNGPGRSGAPNVPYVIRVLDAAAGQPLSSRGIGSAGPRIVKAPWSPNPGRSVGWLFMGGFVGGVVFAGGQLLGASQANSAYTHTFEYEGRLQPELLQKAKDYNSRATLAGIVAAGCLLTSIVLFIVFPEHPDTLVVGGGGDAGVGVRF
jgi:hypothetical protein